MYKNARYRWQFWIDFYEIHMVGAGPPMSDSVVFGNNRPNRTTDMGENVFPKPFFRFKSDGMKFFEEKT